MNLKKTVVLLTFFTCALPMAVEASCGAPANAIEAENCLPGTPTSVWDIPQPSGQPTNAGDASLQGFATDISVNKGETIHFKIKSTSSSYTVDIYRVGYYQGNGARKVASVTPVPYPQAQPTCYSDATGILDCGNWAESASWNVPSTAVSGTYLARLTRTDNGGASQIIFIVRDDDSHAAILFNNSDTTWQAYNAYGGYSFYKGANTAGRAFKISYNRPFTTRLDGSSYFFTHEYPMIRWLELNGYDVTYFTNTDMARRGTLLLNHKVFMANGHDEYWSAEMYTAAKNAQAAGIHTAFLSGNEIYWKTRWEGSFDGTDTAFRTLVCYKESYEDAPIDPLDPPFWTGTWEDARFSPPADGGKAQNALTGQLYRVNAYREDNLQISSEDGKMRFWRNTPAASLAPGASLSYPEILGYEWDEDVDNGSRPAGIINLSSSTYLVDDHKIGSSGSVYTKGWATHKLTLFRKPSGAIVFGAGTMQWAWGLDDTHDHGARRSQNNTIRQATVNLLADMGVNPATLQTGLVPASPSADSVFPTSTITFPHEGDFVAINATTTITGTASDVGGQVGAVEVSVDGGVTWHPTVGRGQWSYQWFANFTTSATIRSRAIDDNLNIEIPSASVTVGKTNPVPTITALSPSSQGPGAPPFTLTVTGTQFVPGAVIRWNGSDRPTTFVNSATLTTLIPSSNVPAEGTANITVFNPAAGGGLSNTQPFIIAITCPCSLWNSSVVPSNASKDANSLEVGMKFRSDITGFVTSVRFYKNSFNTGPHTGHLWKSNGQLLASVDFSSETATGWQQADFSTPIAIQPNTTYVISYFTKTGYGVNQNFFTTKSMDTIPLHGLKSGIDGLNGVFKYAPASVFPTDSYLATNYWIDLVFITSRPVPTLLSLTPASAAIREPGGEVNNATFTFTANGSDFTSASVVQWNGSPRPTVFVSSSSLEASLSKTDIASTGTVSVTVFTPAPGGGLSAPQPFTLYIPNPVPILSSITPSSATVGSSSITITAMGSNFVPGAKFQWGGADRPTTFVDSTTLNAVIPASELISSRAVSVEILNPVPGGGSSNSKLFSIVLPDTSPVAGINSISPSSAIVTSSSFTLTVNGHDFLPASVVQWNGSDRATTFISSAQVAAVILSSDVATVGTSTVTVVTSGNSSNATFFTIVPANSPLPGIDTISPSSSSVTTSSFTLTVNGTNFVPTSVVQWNGADRATTFISSIQVTAVVLPSDAASVGTSTVTVVTPAPGGGTSNAKTFSTVPQNNPLPVVNTISPSSSSVTTSSFTLTVNGTNFVPTSVVQWNGADRATTLISSAQLTAVVLPSDAASVGTSTITVVNPAPGGGTSNAKTFTTVPQNNPIPVINTISPNSANADTSSFTLTVNGIGFLPASIVQFNGSDRLTTFVSSAQVTTTVLQSDIAVVGVATITVTNPAPGGGRSNGQLLTISATPPASVNPVPSISTITPTSVSAGAPGLSVTIYGSDFLSSSTVRWNNSDRSTLFVSSVQVIASIPASDFVNVGVASITVSNPAPGGGVSSIAPFAVTLTPGGNPTPIISSATPSGAVVGGSTLTVTINGSGFISSSVIYWNGTPRATVFVSSTALRASLPISYFAVSTTTVITVVNSAPGGGTSNGINFVVGAANPLPNVASINPTTVLTGSAGFQLVLTGSNFLNSSVVHWNGSPRPTTFVNATTLQAAIPASDLLPRSYAYVTVVNPAPAGGTSASKTFTIRLEPTVTDLSPRATTVGGPDFTLTVIGARYAADSIVRWNGLNRTTVFVSTTQLTASIPASDLVSTGTAKITISNLAPGGVSQPFSFTISSAAVNPAPSVTVITPSSVTAGAAAFVLQVKGTGFITSSVVRWSGANRPTVYVSSNVLTASIPASDLAIAGVFPVTVNTPLPGGGVSNAVNFTVVATLPPPSNPVPGILSITPSSATAGSASFTLQVTGSNFLSSSTVQWNGLVRPSIFVSSTVITASIPASDLTTAGVFPVTVNTPLPGGGISNAVNFTVVLPPPPAPNPIPGLLSITPSSVTAGAAAFTLQLTGSDFLSSSTVQWNGSIRPTVYVSSTILTASIPASDLTAPGSFLITANSPAPGGGSSNALSFVVGSVPVQPNPVPGIGAITPSSATIGDSGLTLQITGSNFISSSTVQWNGIDRSTIYLSPTQLTASIPASDLTTAGSFPITVSNPAPGGGLSNTLNFAVDSAPNAVPSLTTLAPNSVYVSGPSFTLQVNGLGFTDHSTIQWNGSDRFTTFVNSTQLLTTIPSSDLTAIGSFPVTVTNPAPGGGLSTSLLVAVTQPPAPPSDPNPPVNSVAPSSVTIGSPDQQVYITGFNFNGVSNARFNGQPLVTTYINSSIISAIIPATYLTTAGIFPITVSNFDGKTSNATYFTVAIAPPPAPPAPTLGLTNLAPGTVHVFGPSFTLQVTGFGFTDHSTIQWNGSNRPTTFVSSTQLLTTIPASDLTATGSFAITVTNPAPGTTLSNALSVAVIEPPTPPSDYNPPVNSVAPSSATIGSPDLLIYVAGFNFNGVSNVRFNGQPLVTTYINGSLVSATLPATYLTTAGIFPITVSNFDGKTSNATYFTVAIAPPPAPANPVPTVASLTPNSAVAEGSGFALQITGTNFLNSSTVQWNGIIRSSVFISSTQITVTIPAADIAVAGVSTITVTNPAPGGGTSNGVSFTIQAIIPPASNPVPSLTSVTPSSATAGSPSATLQLLGTNFLSSSTVQWNGSLRSAVFVSSTQMTVSIPASDLTTAGVSTITVTNPAPGGGTSNAISFFVQAVAPVNPVPSLTSVTPSSGTAGSSATTLQLSGANFLSSSTVQWNGSARSAIFVNSNQLSVNIPATDLATAGVSTITVTNPAPGGGLSNPVFFTIVPSVPVSNPIPTLTSLSPNSAIAGSAALTIQLTGTAFLSSSTVQWKGSNRPAVFVSSTQMTVSIPASDLTTTGVAAVTVTNPAPGGGSSAAVSFTIIPTPPTNPVPTLSSLAPNSAAAGSAALTVQVNGTAFLSSSTVKWNGVIRPAVFVNSTQLTVSIPASDLVTSTVAAVTVTNPVPGGGTSNALSFTVTATPVNNPVPTLTSLSPNVATAGSSAFTLIVNGSGFVPSASVRWNGSARTTTYVSSTTLNVAIPASDLTAQGTATLSVVNPAPGGGTSNGLPFAIGSAGAAPILDSINPTSLVVGASAFTLTVSGQNFLPNSIVRWNNLDRPTTYVSNTTLTALIPASDLATRAFIPVTVLNQGVGASKSKTFTIRLEPAISSLSPASISAGGPAFNLTINGTKFATDSIVRWNNLDRPTVFISSTQLTASILASDLATPRGVPITVFNASPGGVSPLKTFTVTPVSSTQAVSASDIAVASNFTEMRAFPNPWRVDRHTGTPIKFDQMPLETTVKIFTISGQWVRTLDTVGTIATWDLKNDRGDRVASGAYLYLATTQNGAKKQGIIMVIR